MTETLFDQMKEFITRGVATQRAVNKLCHKSDPETSKGAADKMVKSGALSRQEDEVWRIICGITENVQHDDGYARLGAKDFTAKELTLFSGLDYYTIQRRLSGLCDKGKIERIQSTDRGELLYYKSGGPIYNKRDGCCVWRLK